MLSPHLLELLRNWRRKLLSSQRAAFPSHQPSLQIPIGRCCSTSHRPPRFRSLQVFERRQAEPMAGSLRVAGRHPKTLTQADSSIAGASDGQPPG